MEDTASNKRKREIVANEEESPYKQNKTDSDNPTSGDSFNSLSNHVSTCLSLNCSDCSKTTLEGCLSEISKNESKEQPSDLKSISEENPIKDKPIQSRNSIKQLVKDKALKKGIKDLNLERLTEQQEEILLKLREHPSKNFYIKSSLYSNKELSYLIYAYDLIDSAIDSTQVLIVSPTSESVTFIYKLAKSLFKHTKVRTLSSCYSSDDIFTEIKNSRPHVIVSTLGCTISCINKQLFDINFLKLIVIEESLSLINNDIPDKRCSNMHKITNLSIDSQFIFLTSSFSPTELDSSVDRTRLNDMITLNHLDRKQLFKNILHFTVKSTHQNRYNCLSTVIQNTKFPKIIINVNNMPVNKVISERLRNDFVKVYSLHTDSSHFERERIIYNFIKAERGLLVCCYPLCLNVELEEIQMVINYDPMNLKDCYYQKIAHLCRSQFDSLGFAVNIISSSRIEDETNLIENELGIRFIELRLDES